MRKKYTNIKEKVMKTIVVNLMGAAGSGKSTLATEVFAMLKRKGYNCEYVDEYAKHMVYENNLARLSNQLLVFSNQYFSLDVIRDKVNIIITDSPLLLSIFYNRENLNKNHLKVPDKLLKELVLYCYSTFDNLNYFLTRNHEYKREGRYQTEDEARVQEGKLRELLQEMELDCKYMLSTDNCADQILQDIENRVKYYAGLSKSGMEIERKFILADAPKGFYYCRTENILQGYFIKNEHEVRVRNVNNQDYFLTEKFGDGVMREEYEKAIGREEYVSLMKKVDGRIVQKSRTYVPLENGLMAEVDIYFEKNKGLSTVEVEFESIEQANSFVSPKWFGREITNEAEYKNKNLSLKEVAAAKVSSTGKGENVAGKEKAG